jgi:hypothetical protein
MISQLMERCHLLPARFRAISGELFARKLPRASPAAGRILLPFMVNCLAPVYTLSYVFDLIILALSVRAFLLVALREVSSRIEPLLASPDASPLNKNQCYSDVWRLYLDIIF